MEKKSTPSEKRLPKPNNALKINTSLDGDFFKWWCAFMNPLVHLTNKESDLLATFLKYRWELTKSIKEPSLVDITLMSEPIRQKIIKDCNISVQHYHVLLGCLKKKRIIENNKLIPKIIPNVRRDENGYIQLLILFADAR